MNKPFSKLIMAFTILMASVTAPVYAATAPVMSGKLCAFAGANWLDLSALNTQLVTSSYPALSTPFFSYGFLYQIVQNNVALDLEYQQYHPQSGESGAYSSIFDGWDFTINVGYTILNTSWIQLYPVIGIGRECVSLKITDKTSTNFTDLLANPSRTINLTRYGWSFNIALGVDFILPTGKSAPPVVVGLRGGYKGTISMEDWNVNGEVIPGGADASLGGGYIRLVVGISE